jgi:hypothetical protein
VTSADRAGRARRRRLGWATATLATLAALAPAGARAAAGPNFWGLNLAFYDNVPGSDMARLSRAGLRTMRVTIGWSDIQPTPDTTDWSRPDALVGRLAQLGIRAQPTLLSSPYWVNGLTAPTGLPLSGQTHATPPVGSPQATAAWRSFVEAVVNRYKPGGAFWTGPFAREHPGAKPVPIRRWQIWNEPNIPQFFAPQPSAEEYARLVKVAHAGMHAADPQAKLALAGLPSTTLLPGAEFLREFYRVPGIKRDFDVVAVHPYGASLAQVKSNIRADRRVMLEAHDARTPVWVSEIAWGSAPSDGNINVGRDGQARRVARTMEMLQRNRKDLNIGEVSWFVFRDPHWNGHADCRWCPFAGLIDSHDRPKPAWRVFKQIVAGG